MAANTRVCLGASALSVAAPDRSNILKLDRNGAILEKWASFGNYDGQLFWGHDIAVGKDGSVYVGDILGRCVQKFSQR
jgi:hypothetical protein